MHEIKHDGFRVIARKNDKWVRLYSRSGNDLTERFPLIVEAMASLGANSSASKTAVISAPPWGRHNVSYFPGPFDTLVTAMRGK